MFGKYKYHLLLHLIIFMWGFTGILGKLIHLEALYIVWHRVLIAFVALGLALFFIKKSLRPASVSELVKIVLVGVIVASHWVSFYYTIQLSTASLGILCLSTTTLHVTWLEPLIMRRRFSWIEFGFGLFVVGGIYFVSGDFSAKELNALYIGLFSAFLAALFSVLNARLVQETPSYKITFYEMVSGFIFLSVVLLVQGKMNHHLFEMRWEDFSWLLFLGVLCTSFAFLATIEVVKKLGAFTVSLSINLEPVYTILLAVILLHENEQLNPRFYLGAVLIIIVVLINAFYKAYKDKIAAKKA